MAISEQPLNGNVDIQRWDDATSAWVPLIQDATGLSIRRGGTRDGLGVKTDVVLATFTLHDAEDPLDGGHLVPGQAIRVIAGATPEEKGHWETGPDVVDVPAHDVPHPEEGHFEPGPDVVDVPAHDVEHPDEYGWVEQPDEWVVDVPAHTVNHPGEEVYTLSGTDYVAGWPEGTTKLPNYWLDSEEIYKWSVDVISGTPGYTHAIMPGYKYSYWNGTAYADLPQKHPLIFNDWYSYGFKDGQAHEERVVARYLRTIPNLHVGVEYTFTVRDYMSYDPWSFGVTGIGETSVTESVYSPKSFDYTFTATATSHEIYVKGNGGYLYFQSFSVTAPAWTEEVPEQGHWEEQPDAWEIITPAWTEHVPTTYKPGPDVWVVDVEAWVEHVPATYKPGPDVWVVEPLEDGILHPEEGHWEEQPDAWVIDEPEYSVNHPAEEIYFQDFEGGNSFPHEWAPGPDTEVYITYYTSDLGHNDSVYMARVTKMTPPYSGQVYATRTFDDLVIGASYTVRAWASLNSPAATYGATKNAKIGVEGKGYGPVLVTPTLVPGWKEVTYTFTATETSHVVRLEHTTTVTGSNSSHTSIMWDDVSLTRNSWTETFPEVGHWEERPDKWVVDVPAWIEPFLTPIFTGRLAHISSTYPMDKTTGKSRASVTVTVADAVQIHGSTMRYGIDLGSTTNETFEARIARLEGSANAPVEIPTVGAPRGVYVF